MMKIAAIYDIHGNLPALDAVLLDIELVQPDLIVVGGDVAAGPLPVATIERLMSLGHRTRFVRGNADRELVTCCDGGTPNPRLPAVAQDTLQWVAGQLGRIHRDSLATFVEHVSATVDELGAILFCHGSPRSDEEILTAITPEERAREALADVTAQVVVCGHTHMQFDRTIGAIRLVNAGSVGMPYGDPGAYWLLLGPEVELRRTAYDLDAAAALIRASGYPLADDFADNNVLAAPAAAAALALFEGRKSDSSDD